MKQQRFIPATMPRVFVAALAAVLLGVGAASRADEKTAGAAGQIGGLERPLENPAEPGAKDEAQYPGWATESRLKADQWVGNWLISRDGEAQHVWSLNKDGTGRSYAFSESGGKMKFSYGYDIRWYFDPFTQMANIKTERRIVCRGGRLYPYFLTLKSYESDYVVKGKYAWQTTWTEASIGRNYLHKSLVVFIAPLSGWHNPEKDAPCPQFPRMDIEKDIDTALDRWDMEAEVSEVLVDTTPVEGEPEFQGEEFGPAPKSPKGKVPQPRKDSAKARIKDKSRKKGTKPKQPKRN
ncbi:hypothetical protein M0G74_12705 [Microbulbifer sp. CAU 1566]|uniref:hypothetical protein n=1 Tax=Microbulbifer sp. CAU 1566 TaxID=2933269 RepID=UPI002006112E|nr:hypothetical protein [Microbulbifer sp. CAU 1566]MCK7598135.1 hypothetical protein [Microbulbifer sp. CAU 1566]